MLEYNFGLRVCNEHVEWANRDLKAFQFRIKRYKMSSLKMIDCLKPFFDALSGGFSVRRSNGTFDKGWFVNEGDYFNTEYLSFTKERDSWTIPCVKPSESLTKYIKLGDFLEPEIISSLPANFKEVHDGFMAILNSGIYSEEEKEYQYVMNREQPVVVADESFIGTGLINGQVCRVLMNT